MEDEAKKFSLNGNKSHDLPLPTRTNEPSPWIHAVCVVTFDIELGQAIESLYPRDAQLSEKEKSNICYSAFPDSNSSIMGETQYHFRTKIQPIEPCLSAIYEEFNTNSAPAIHVDDNFIYGYVHFLQKKDHSQRRGYFQKSLVMLSRLPFVKLFYHIVSIVGIDYFENEHLMDLENIYKQILRWPPLQAGTTLNLSLVGTTVSFYIPNRDDKLNNFHPNSSKNTNKLPGNSLFARRTPIVPHTNLTAFDLNLHNCFQSVISDLQLLWEMILTCEPLIVMAQTPDVCSEFVQGLVSLIWPFKYNADFRPFFTIHDFEFREYVGKKQSTPNVILGVTNPFFAKSLEHWPSVVRLTSIKTSKSSEQLLLPPKNTIADKLKFSKGQSWILNVTDINKPGLNTKVKPFLLKDRNFLTNILKSNQGYNDRPANVQTTLIRRWLVEMTHSFFMPLERYLAQLMPLHKKITPFRTPPELPEFDLDAFLSTLDISGPQLTTGIKGDWIGLYKKFYSCPNFSTWYQDRKIEIDNNLRQLHLKSIMEIDMDSKGEVEVVDMIIFLREKLMQTNGSSSLTDENVVQLKDKLNKLIDTLPIDLQPAFEKVPFK